MLLDRTYLQTARFILSHSRRICAAPYQASRAQVRTLSTTQIQWERRRPTQRSKPSPPPTSTTTTTPPEPEVIPYAEIPSRTTPAPPTPSPPADPSTVLATYTDTLAPTPAQLRYSTRFFTSFPPTFLHGTSHFRTLPLSSIPEVAFLGRSNVGKSSLLNALFGRERNEVARTSKRPGRTREMNAFGVGGVTLRKGNAEVLASQGDAAPKAFDRWTTSARSAGGALVVMDMPGYGRASRDEWGREISKYLASRKQLRRVFVLVHALHGVKESDRLLLRMLREESVPHQIVLTKVDELVGGKAGKVSEEGLARASNRIREKVQEVLRVARPADWRGMSALGDVLVTSSTAQIADGSRVRDRLGIDHVRYAVLQAAGLESDAEGRVKRVVVEVLRPEGAWMEARGGL